MKNAPTRQKAMQGRHSKYLCSPVDGTKIAKICRSRKINLNLSERKEQADER